MRRTMVRCASNAGDMRRAAPRWTRGGPKSKSVLMISSTDAAEKTVFKWSDGVGEYFTSFIGCDIVSEKSDTSTQDPQQSVLAPASTWAPTCRLCPCALAAS